MNVKKSAILLASVAIFSLGGAVVAQDSAGSDDDNRKERSRWHVRGGADPQRMIEMMTRRLDLDETQAQTVANIVESARPEFESLRESGRSQREAMRELQVSDPDYGSKLQNLAAERGELAAASTQLRGRVRAEIHAVLTPEQQQKMAEFESNRRQRGGFRNGGRGRHGQRGE